MIVYVLFIDDLLYDFLYDILYDFLCDCLYDFLYDCLEDLLKKSKNENACSFKTLSFFYFADVFCLPFFVAMLR